MSKFADSLPSKVWDRIWAKDSYAHPKIREQRASEKLQNFIHQGFLINYEDRVLDIGCGDGAILANMAMQFPTSNELYACDISEVALRLARARFKNLHISANAICADVLSLPFPDNHFDKITVFGVLEHVRDVDIALSQIHRVLKKTGEVVFCTSSKLSLIYPMRKVREYIGYWPYGYQRNYSSSEFIELINPFFECIDPPLSIHTQFDFPILKTAHLDLNLYAAIDRLIGVIYPMWGRYLIIRCGKW